MARTRPTLALPLAGLMLLSLAATAAAQDDERPPLLEGPDGPDGTTTDVDDSTDDGMPIPLAQRPLTLPEGTLRVDTAFGLTHRHEGILRLHGGSMSEGDIHARLRAGAALGVIEDLEVGLVAVPLILSPDFDYEDVPLYVVYRFMSGDFEMGARMELRIPTDTDFGIAFGVPMLIHAGDSFRIDTGVQIGIVVNDDGYDDDTRVGLYSFSWPSPIPTQRVLGIPAVFTLNATDALYLGLNTAFGVLDFSTFGDSMFIALGLHGGYTLERDGTPFMDISGRFQWPTLFAPGEDSSDDRINPERWEAVVGAEIYLDLY